MDPPRLRENRGVGVLLDDGALVVRLQGRTLHKVGRDRPLRDLLPDAASSESIRVLSPVETLFLLTDRRLALFKLQDTVLTSLTSEEVYTSLQPDRACYNVYRHLMQVGYTVRSDFQLSCPLSEATRNCLRTLRSQLPEAQKLATHTPAPPQFSDRQPEPLMVKRDGSWIPVSVCMSWEAVAVPPEDGIVCVTSSCSEPEVVMAKNSQGQKATPPSNFVTEALVDISKRLEQARKDGALVKCLLDMQPEYQKKQIFKALSGIAGVTIPRVSELAFNQPFDTLTRSLLMEVSSLRDSDQHVVLDLVVSAYAVLMDSRGSLKPCVSEDTLRLVYDTFDRLPRHQIADWTHVWSVDDVPVPTERLLEYANHYARQEKPNLDALVPMVKLLGLRFDLRPYLRGLTAAQCHVFIGRFPDILTDVIEAQVESSPKLAQKLISSHGLNPTDFPALLVSLAERDSNGVYMFAKKSPLPIRLYRYCFAYGSLWHSVYLHKSMHERASSLKPEEVMALLHIVKDKLELESARYKTANSFGWHLLEAALRAYQTHQHIAEASARSISLEIAKYEFRGGLAIQGAQSGVAVRLGLIAIQVVSTLRDVELLLDQCQEAKVVGVDAEFRSTIEVLGLYKGVSVLQIALPCGTCYLVDVKSLDREHGLEFHQLMSKRFFSNPEILKVGHSFLQNDWPNITCTSPAYTALLSLVDVRDLLVWKGADFIDREPRLRVASLATVVSTVLGIELPKGCQVFNWGFRPLLQDYAVYAALDAWVLLKCLVVGLPHYPLVELVSMFIKERPVLPKYISPQQTPKLLAAPETGQARIQAIKRSCNPPWRFVVPSSIEKVGRQLRGCGVDCVITSNNSKDVLVAAARDDRVVLRPVTSSFVDNWSIPTYPLAHRLSTTDMVQEVLREFGISFDHKDICKRCAKCNGDEWNVVGADAVKGMVFECTRLAFDSFWVCKHCSQVYWEGPMYKLAMEHFNAYRTNK